MKIPGFFPTFPPPPSSTSHPPILADYPINPSDPAAIIYPLKKGADLLFSVDAKSLRSEKKREGKEKTMFSIAACLAACSSID